MSELKGSLALVTGVGRAEGIGAAVCRRLAQEGADIFYTYWHQYDAEQYPNSKDPKAFLDELQSFGVRADCEEADLSKPNAPHDLFNAVTSRLGTPDILINNACYDREAKFTALTPEVLDRHYEINIRAATLLCAEFMKHFKKTSGGRIINMTSGQSLDLMNPDQIPYTITKAGLEMLARQLAPLIAPKGITINAVDPGPTDTGWMTNELKKEIKSNSIVNEPVDVANAIASLLLEDMSGEVIHVGRD